MVRAVAPFLVLIALAGQPATAGEAARSSRLQGKASLDRGRPVVGASVLVHGSEDRKRFLLTSTDSRGRFVFDGLPDGSYRVEIRRVGLESVVKDDVRVRAPFRAVVEVMMRPREGGPGPEPASVGESRAQADRQAVEIRGRVRERADGAPLTDVRVRLVHVDGAADPILLLSDGKGEFRAVDVTAGGYRVEITAAGFLAARADVTLVEAAVLEVELARQPPDYQATPLELMPRERLLEPLQTLQPSERLNAK